MELDLLMSGNGTPVSLANQTEPALTSLDQAEDPGVGHPLLTRFQRNLRFDDTTLCALLFVYVVLIAFGTLANGLIILAVVRQRKMRLLRHALIVNLAFSDILLCLLTMPLTLMQLVTLYWPLGRWEFMCRLTCSLEAVSIFVSTLTIAAIAVDRYKLIVYPTCRTVQNVGVLGLLLLIWLLGLTLAAPLFVFRRLIHHQINFPGLSRFVDSIDYCVEDWPTYSSRTIYSTSASIIQYIVPISILAFAHAGICKKLRHRMRSSTALTASNCTGESGLMKTNRLLSAVALTFAISWLPLNIFNLVVDSANPFGDDLDTMLIIYAVCHLCGMSSACVNPLLYGWLNVKLRQEIVLLIRCCSPANQQLDNAPPSNRANTRSAV